MGLLRTALAAGAAAAALAVTAAVAAAELAPLPPSLGITAPKLGLILVEQEGEDAIARHDWPDQRVVVDVACVNVYGVANDVSYVCKITSAPKPAGADDAKWLALRKAFATQNNPDLLAALGLATGATNEQVAAALAAIGISSDKETDSYVRFVNLGDGKWRIEPLGADVAKYFGNASDAARKILDDATYSLDRYGRARAKTTGYGGMTAAKVNAAYKVHIGPLKVISTAKTRYCVSSTVGQITWYLRGPGGEPSVNACK